MYDPTMRMNRIKFIRWDDDDDDDDDDDCPISRTEKAGRPDVFY
jgi:hypothetical protein